jgi:uncharacterized protein YwgA
MLSKSDLLLLLLSADNGEPIRGKTRLMKLAYIATRELGKTIPLYKFRRYYYGPFSDELVDDLESLVHQGLISHSEELMVSSHAIYVENVYSITERGDHILQEKTSGTSFRKLLDIVSEVKRKYNHIPLSMLINQVYLNYPLKE